MSRRGVVGLVGLCLLAALLRVGLIHLTHATQAKPEENRLIAANLAAGRGFAFTEFGITGPTAVRGPAYPMLLAVLGPDRVGLALSINVIAGAAGVIAAFLLSRRLLDPLPSRNAFLPIRPPRAAWAVAVLFAVWPTQLYAATLTQGLAIAVPLTLAALCLAVRGTPPAALAAGALAGLTSLTEPALALPLLLVAIAIGRRVSRQSAALYVVTACVVVSPWLYRNALVSGRPTPITSNFWRDAFLGNGPDASGSRVARLDPKRSDGHPGPPDLTRIDLLGPAEFDALKRPEPQRLDVMSSATLRWLIGHPGQYVVLCGKRLWQIVTFGYPHPMILHSGWGIVGEVLNFGLMFGFATFLFIVRRSLYRSIVLLLAIGLLLPMVFVMTDVRMLPLLDIPLLLAVFPPAVLLPRRAGVAEGRAS